MKRITKISAQKRSGRYNIFLNDQYAFSVTTKIMAEFVLVKDKELTDEQISTIKQADQNARAEEKALGFLGYQPRSIKELHDYLKKQEVEEEVISTVIDNLISLGYLNDTEYARLFTRNNLNVGHEGQRGVLSKLAQKGVSKDIAQEIIDEVEINDWIELAEKLVKPLQKKAGKISQKDLQMKMQQKMYQHGFSSEVIIQVLASQEEVAEEDQYEALRIQGIKAYKKARKYSGFERDQKIKQFLFQKGFSSNEISQFLAGEIISFEELEEY